MNGARPACHAAALSSERSHALTKLAATLPAAGSARGVAVAVVDTPSLPEDGPVDGVRTGVASVVRCAPGRTSVRTGAVRPTMRASADGAHHQDREHEGDRAARSQQGQRPSHVADTSVRISVPARLRAHGRASVPKSSTVVTGLRLGR